VLEDVVGLFAAEALPPADPFEAEPEEEDLAMEELLLGEGEATEDECAALPVALLAEFEPPFAGFDPTATVETLEAGATGAGGATTGRSGSAVIEETVVGADAVTVASGVTTGAEITGVFSAVVVDGVAAVEELGAGVSDFTELLTVPLVGVVVVGACTLFSTPLTASEVLLPPFEIPTLAEAAGTSAGVVSTECLGITDTVTVGVASPTGATVGRGAGLMDTTSEEDGAGLFGAPPLTGSNVGRLLAGLGAGATETDATGVGAGSGEGDTGATGVSTEWVGVTVTVTVAVTSEAGATVVVGAGLTATTSGGEEVELLGFPPLSGGGGRLLPGLEADVMEPEPAGVGVGTAGVDTVEAEGMSTVTVVGAGSTATVEGVVFATLGVGGEIPFWEFAAPLAD
jgi:hypothetical protein